MKTLKFKMLIIVAATILANVNYAQNVHHGDLTQNGSLYFRAEPVNNYISADKSNYLYYYVHLQGLKKESDKNKKRIPLNLSLVIDKSGSMEGDKLRFTKEAVKYVINQLDKNDVLSIVLYDTDVRVLLDPQKLENKESIIKKVNDIQASGSTNLEGGMTRGYELIKSVQKLVGADMVNRVLLLSDGLANVGISDPVLLSSIARNYFEKDRISISTFGVGIDYNEDLMAKIAMQGGGMYYFINSPEKLPSIFNQELKGVSQVVAKNTLVKITFPADLLEFDKVFVYSGVVIDNTLQLSFNDIFSEEQKAILIHFKVKKKITSPVNLQCFLSYSNSLNDSLIAINDNRKSEINIAKDEKQYNSGFNKAASEGYALQISGEIYEEAVQAGNNEEYEKAKIRIREAKEVLNNHFKTIGDNPYLKDLYDKLTEYEKIISDLKKMSREEASYHNKFFKHRKFKSVSCPSF